MVDEKTRAIDKAQKLAQKGYFEKSIAEYRKIVEKDPRDATIRLRIGDLYVKMNKSEDAIKEYCEVAKIHNQKGFYLKAIAVYKQVLKLDESLMEIHLKLAELYIKQRLIADAVSEYSAILGFYDKKGRYGEATDTIHKMIAIDPQNTGIRLKLAEYYKKTGFAKDALDEYGRVFDDFIKNGKIDKAEKLYLGLYEDNKKSIQIAEGLVELYGIKGDNASLLNYYDVLANLYRDHGETEKRNAVYEKILAIDPLNAKALNTLGRKPPISQQIAIEKEPRINELETISEAVRPEEAAPPEPLITWPEINIEFKEEPAAAIASKEEPIINWNEMVEVGKAVEETSGVAAPAEATLSVEQPDVSKTSWNEMTEVSDAWPAAGAIHVEIKEEKPLEMAPLIEEPVAAEEQKAPLEALRGPVIEELPEPVEEILDVEEVERPVESFDVLQEVSVPVIDTEKTLLEQGSGEEASQEESSVGEDFFKDLTSPPDGGYVDISAELGLDEGFDFLSESWASHTKDGESFNEFKQGVEKQLNREDSETHYNLGIAYMEMEMHSEAMREFKIAMKSPAFEFDCYARLGICLMTKGAYKDAIGYYLKGLKVAGKTEVERRGLSYELGLAYEAAGNLKEAFEVFSSINAEDKGFREVSSKVRELGRKVKKEDAGGIPHMDNMLEVELL